MNQSVKYQNHQINYSLEGSGEPLIFLHGWPTNSKLWKSQVEVFKADYKIITIDWLGFGKSDRPADWKYTFTKKKEVLDAVLSQLLEDHEKVNIIAHDVGGPPAILWASENQERVKRLILLNTIIFPFSTSLDKMSHFFFRIPIIKNILVSQFGLKCLMRTLTKSKGETIRSRMEEILEANKEVSSEIKLKTILEPLETGKNHEFLTLAEKFKRLRRKRYLVIAKGDPLCFEHIQKLSKENPDIPAYYIKDCGHYIPIDKPEALNEILAKILKKGESD